MLPAGLIVPLSPADATTVNESIPNAAWIVWFAPIPRKTYAPTAPMLASSTSTAVTCQCGSGVIANARLSPRLTAVEPAGAIVPFGPAEAVIV